MGKKGKGRGKRSEREGKKKGRKGEREGIKRGKRKECNGKKEGKREEMESVGKPDDKGKGIEANAMGKGREQRET